jgi:hypothetical protein
MMELRQSDISYSSLNTDEEDEDFEGVNLSQRRLSKRSRISHEQKLKKKGQGARCGACELFFPQSLTGRIIFTANNLIITGIKVSCIFCLSGIIFLSTIAMMLWRNSVYIRVSNDSSRSKRELAKGVTGAILLYLLGFLWTSYLWYRSSSGYFELRSIRRRIEL